MCVSAPQGDAAELCGSVAEAAAQPQPSVSQGPLWSSRETRGTCEAIPCAAKPSMEKPSPSYSSYSGRLRRASQKGGVLKKRSPV